MARIVIAEDQVHIRHVLKMWMTRHGHEVLEAGNGLEALEHLRGNDVDLLITDVNMPQMDGIELTRSAFDACPTLCQVFVLTSSCNQQQILSQLDDPRVRVIPKPFSPSQLLHDVEQAVGDRSAASQEDGADASPAPTAATGGGG